VPVRGTGRAVLVIAVVVLLAFGVGEEGDVGCDVAPSGLDVVDREVPGGERGVQAVLEFVEPIAGDQAVQRLDAAGG